MFRNFYILSKDSAEKILLVASSAPASQDCLMHFFFYFFSRFKVDSYLEKVFYRRRHDFFSYTFPSLVIQYLSIPAANTLTVLFLPTYLASTAFVASSLPFPPASLLKKGPVPPSLPQSAPPPCSLASSCFLTRTRKAVMSLH